MKEKQDSQRNSRKFWRHVWMSLSSKWRSLIRMCGTIFLNTCMRGDKDHALLLAPGHFRWTGTKWIVDLANRQTGKPANRQTGNPEIGQYLPESLHRVNHHSFKIHSFLGWWGGAGNRMRFQVELSEGVRL